MTYKVTFRVYYEDTDCGGVVYHSNYLNFAERARTEMLRATGVNQIELAKNYGIYFVVQKLDINYIKPLELDDLVEICTEVIEIKMASMQIEQTMMAKDNKIAVIRVKIACVKKEYEVFKPCKIPIEIKNNLQKHE